MEIVNFNKENFDREFYFAASMGDADTIRDIFERGDFSGINTRSPEGNTPLIIACAWGLDADESVHVFRFSDVIELLVENGADINAINNRGRSPLYMLASWGYWDIVEYLLKQGADVSDPEILRVASFTKPRPGRNRGNQMYYNNVYAKQYGYKVAKLLTEDLKETGMFGEILTNLDEDYNRIVSYAAQDLPEDIPDDVMNIIVYYTHFATVVQLVQFMQPDVPVMESDLFLDSIRVLDEHRELFENLQRYYELPSIVLTLWS